MALNFTDQDIVNFLSTQPKFAESSTTSTTATTPIKKIPQFDTDEMAQELRISGPTKGGVSGIPEYQSNLKEIWNGFRQGTASVVDSIDAVTNLVSRATGMEKGKAFEKLRDYINPTPEEVADKNFGASLLRAIGAAGPIIGEFAIGTKGAGKLIKLAKLPEAIGGIGTAAPVAFAGIEGLTTAGKGGTLEEVAKQTLKGGVLGTALGVAGKFRPAINIHAVGITFGGMAALEGADTQDIAIQTLLGLGFGVHGAWKSSKQMNIMRDFLAKQGRDINEITKMNPNKLRDEFVKTRKQVATDILIRSGMNTEDIAKMSDIEIEEAVLKRNIEESKRNKERIAETQKQYEGDPEGFKAKNKQRYIDFLVEKGFNAEKLQNVSLSNFDRLLNFPDPRLYKIDPISGEVTDLKTAKAKKIRVAVGKSSEELQKDIVESTDQATKERAQAENAKKESQAERIARGLEEEVLEKREQGIVKEEELDPAIKQKIQQAAIEARDDWYMKEDVEGTPRLSYDQFEQIRQKYSIPEANREDMFRFFKENDISLVKPTTITDADMVKFLEESITEEVGVKEPVIPSRVRRAFGEKNIKLDEKIWNALKPEEQKAFEELLDIYYKGFDLLKKSEEKYKEYKKSHPKGGRPPENIVNKEWREQLHKQTSLALKDIRSTLKSYLSKERIHLAVEGREATEGGPKVRLKSALIKFSKATRTALEKRGFPSSTLNAITSTEDVRRLRQRTEIGPSDIDIDEYGRVIWPEVKMARTRETDLLKLIEAKTSDDVLKSMNYSLEEIDTARGKREVIPVEEKVKKKTQAEKALETIVSKEEVPTKKKGRIKTLEQAELVWERYLTTRPGQEQEEGGYRTTEEGKREKVRGRSAEDIELGRINAKRELEEFVGKKNLSDEQLENELVKLSQSEATKTTEVTKKPTPTTPKIVKNAYDFLSEEQKSNLEQLGWSEESLRRVENPQLFDRIIEKSIIPEIAQITEAGKLFVFGKGSPEHGYGERSTQDSEKLLGDQSIIMGSEDLKEEVTKRGPVPKPDTGERNPDELVSRAYLRSRNATPLEKSRVDFAKAADKLLENGNQRAKIELKLNDPNLDPRLRGIYEETLVVLNGELPKISAEFESLKKMYGDMKEVAGIEKEPYNGPLPGEIRINKYTTLDDGTGGLIVSEGGHGVDRFYLLQDQTGTPSRADSVGNKIAVEARVTKSDENPNKVELRVFRSSPEVNPRLEDELLKSVVNEYTAMGKKKMRQVSQVPGVGDEVWARRGDIESQIRKPTSKTDMESNLKEDLTNISRTHSYINWITKGWGGVKGWKKSYEQRADLLEAMSTLKSAADPQQFDPERFRAEVFPEHERMLGLIEILGDPTFSKIPIIRYIAQKVTQSELQVQYLTNHYIKKFNDTFGTVFKDNPDRQKQFWEHAHRVNTSTDPIILEAYKNYRMVKEDMANVLGAKERGWYLDEYATIRYDMNKVWDKIKQPFEFADSYAELNENIKAAMIPDAFETARSLAKTYKTWESIPRASQDWLQQNVLNFQGIWSNWAYLPEFLQRALPKKFFVGNMQARTAGDAFKSCLDYDFFDIERAYTLSMVRGALMNETLKEVRPLINSLPNASRFGSVRNYLEKYVKTVSGTKPTILDPFWNDLAKRVNETMQANIVPLYLPTTISREYIPLLYRGLLGPDTALRNLTQTVYTLAGTGPKPVLKGVLNYVDAWRKKTPEFQKFEEMINLPDEFLEISRPIIAKKGTESHSKLDTIRYINHKITKVALSPMRLTEHINKGIAYFAGLEDALAKGYDLNTAHIVGTAKASRIFESLTLTEGQYKALRSTYETQFGYTSAHTSPYLQGAGIKMFTPFWSFPIKTAQMIWNNALLNPIGGKTVLGKSDHAWLRFMALTGFMATAPIVTSNLFGIDTKNIWGKGVFPFTIYPAWMTAIGNIFQSVGGDPGDFLERERAKDYMLNFVGQITIPNYRWGSKVYRDTLNAERGYREYGREKRPIVETSWLDEVGDIFGFPPSKFRDAMDAMKEYKDEKFKNMIRKHYYLYKSVDAMEDKDYPKALEILKEAKKEYGLEISSLEVQNAIAKKKEDIWDYTKTAAPKAIRKRPEFQKTMGEARERFIPSKARAYGTKPMWSSLSETLEKTSGGTTETPIYLEE